MQWKLGDSIARGTMHSAGGLHLFHGVVPLGTRLIHFLSSSVLYEILFVFVSAYKPNDLPRAWNDGCMQVHMPAIGQNEFVEGDSEFMRRGKVSIQGTQCSRAAWDGVYR